MNFIKINSLILILSLFVSPVVYGAQVVFFKSYNAYGKLVSFEGLYSHSAVSYKGQWLHAHPRYGVQLTQDLKAFGPHFIILENPHYPEPSDNFVKEQLSMEFHIFAHWFSKNQTYCSKLVGQAFGISPTKMYFNSKDWQYIPGVDKYRGQLGLSPNDVYWHLRRNLRFKKVDKKYIDENTFARSPIIDAVSTDEPPKECSIFLELEA